MCAGTNKSLSIFDMNVGRNVRIMTDVHTRPVHTICQNEVLNYSHFIDTENYSFSQTRKKW